jgi:hypothetical protein
MECKDEQRRIIATEDGHIKIADTLGVDAQLRRVHHNRSAYNQRPKSTAVNIGKDS